MSIPRILCTRPSVLLRPASATLRYGGVPFSSAATAAENLPAETASQAEPTSKISATTPNVPGQAKNRSTIWSQHQNPKAEAMNNPRFEQILMDYQPNPLSALELINSQPVVQVHNRIVACDGGGGALGHPKVYINLDEPGLVVACGYCGTKYNYDHGHDHHNH
ncbi:zinc-finger domain-containing protein [Cladochytrium replicatum]|nr:zinc-finger domain-containing protein [Cladochytrium replicatum]